MKGTIVHIKSEYGGAEGYFLKMTSLDLKTLEMARDVLLVPTSLSSNL
jgi:hypothetical protein